MRGDEPGGTLSGAERLVFSLHPRGLNEAACFDSAHRALFPNEFAEHAI